MYAFVPPRPELVIRGSCGLRARMRRFRPVRSLHSAQRHRCACASEQDSLGTTRPHTYPHPRRQLPPTSNSPLSTMPHRSRFSTPHGSKPLQPLSTSIGPPVSTPLQILTSANSPPLSSSSSSSSSSGIAAQLTAPHDAQFPSAARRMLLRDYPASGPSLKKAKTPPPLRMHSKWTLHPLPMGTALQISGLKLARRQRARRDEAHLEA
ncbi:hypothetical protein DFH27DRAFT_382676 [Peziza echinospora]|nr:hypothetical protein DFH27DRAFT_382676 [Peziza echinospora]